MEYENTGKCQQTLLGTIFNKLIFGSLSMLALHMLKAQVEINNL